VPSGRRRFIHIFIEMISPRRARSMETNESIPTCGTIARGACVYRDGARIADCFNVKSGKVGMAVAAEIATALELQTDLIEALDNTTAALDACLAYHACDMPDGLVKHRDEIVREARAILARARPSPAAS
jgi:hypothetical protein